MTADGIRDATMSGADFLEVIDHVDRAKSNGAAPPLPVFMSADDFISGYQPHRPPIKAWDLKRGWFYSFTAPTGGAKTAIALCEAIELAQQGARVVFMAGENPDDVRARVILMQANLGLDQLPATLRFVDRTFNLADNLEHVRHQVETMSGADLIAVDTSPAFQVASGGMEEKNNPEAIRWAQRLRELTKLQGKPSVLALCHPIKRPQSIEDCLPRGGGGFLAETDGNYASWCSSETEDDKFSELRWAGKFRGHISPISYHVGRATCDRLVDADGNPVFSVWARRADDQQTERAAAAQTEGERAPHRDGGLSKQEPHRLGEAARLGLQLGSAGQGKGSSHPETPVRPQARAARPRRSVAAAGRRQEGGQKGRRKGAR